ncbi:1324_t:CDS:2, partial [Acaulospora morrowiae]
MPEQIIKSLKLINVNPTIYGRSKASRRILALFATKHPLTLEELNVTQLDHVKIDSKNNRVLIEFTPTIPHCSMATLIGLCIRVRLLRSLPERFKVDIMVRKGTHQSEQAGA